MRMAGRDRQARRKGRSVRRGERLSWPGARRTEHRYNFRGSQQPLALLACSFLRAGSFFVTALLDQQLSPQVSRLCGAP